MAKKGFKTAIFEEDKEVGKVGVSYKNHCYKNHLT